MPKRSVGWAYILFAFAVVLAAVAVVGALAAGVDRQTALSTFLITNTAIGLSAAPCGLLIARAKPSNPIGWLFLIAGHRTSADGGHGPGHDLRRRERLADGRAATWL